ncbi:MAG: hypothetical protein IRD7MM_04655 [Candidatus Midichloria mitochondrii]|nr:hypothetical protein [Candidatus Midichloria mitochondrii]MDJ1288382.1 hypothetical protein [Candidatus Midichloria mitochondrii]MDJ1299221.1 hypothetical protein [Candidatus Midichloria mitochondrii]MDJ1313323.1 hypothetical protein [Candidatus Midichloria mitochondrii]MDJ1583895.1 hypothetical protein [Candidatus Midichloria mitochondrii]
MAVACSATNPIDVNIEAILVTHLAILPYKCSIISLIDMRPLAMPGNYRQQQDGMISS